MSAMAVHDCVRGAGTVGRWMAGTASDRFGGCLGTVSRTRLSGVAASGSRPRGGRYFRRIEGRAYPAAVLLAGQLVSRPVVLVELQRDHVRLAIPTNRLQTQGSAVGLV